MKDWRAMAVRLKEGLAARWTRLAAWAGERRDRLVPAAGFLGGSLAVFLALALVMPSPAARVAERYLDAAFSYDYMGLYSLFDDRVLEGELARYGLDRSRMDSLARTNSEQLAGYVADIERRCGVSISFAPAIEDQRPLARGEREALEGRYAADGIALDIRDARRVSAQVVVQMTRGDQAQTLPRELELTAIATPRGWSLDRESMYAFLDIIYDLPAAAQAAPDT